MGDNGAARADAIAMINILLLLVSAETGVIAALLWRFVLV
jgi:hypothetical protein